MDDRGDDDGGNAWLLEANARGLTLLLESSSRSSKFASSSGGAPIKRKDNVTGAYTVYDGNGMLLKRTVHDRAQDTAPATDSVVYIGGVFEKNTITGGVRKYYSVAGRTIAVREVPTGVGQGSLAYLLADHLGSTVEVLDSAGATLSEVTYWPYGATRSGGVSETDQMYTGQRQEPLDSALGIYNYRARFYSSTLGRFVSGDPLTDGRRYAYANNRPLVYVDPAGLDAAVFCGTDNECESGSIGNYKDWVQEYWRQHEHIFQGDSPIPGVSMADYAFAMLQIALANGWAQLDTLAAFHVAFWNTSTAIPGGLDKGLLSYTKRNWITGVGDLKRKFWYTESAAARAIDTLMGYSLGGYVVGSILAESAERGFFPEMAILVQPAFHVSILGLYDAGMGVPLQASAAPRTRIVTINGSDSPVGGTVVGALNLVTSGCGHCAQPGRGVSAFAIWAGSRPLGSADDRLIADAARVQGIILQWMYYPPVASQLPTPY